jgi:hypothetical protein
MFCLPHINLLVTTTADEKHKVFEMDEWREVSDGSEVSLCYVESLFNTTKHWA